MKTKELTIEEKAKAYDEVLERAKELLEVGLKDTRDKRVILSFFPELAKSEDERIREKVIATIHLYYGEPLEDEAKEMIYWLEKQGEQTAEWSKEDKRNFDIIYGIIYNSCIAEDASRLNAWLLSLKDRVQPQPKQEWNEEDINMIDWLIRCCEKEHEELCNDKYGHQDIVSDLKRDCRKKCNWLESLKNRVAPQKQWKPNDNELEVLRLAAEKDGTCLMGLYEQLKKLKG